jgi:hypothetical protein
LHRLLLEIKKEKEFRLDLVPILFQKKEETKINIIFSNEEKEGGAFA